MSTDERAEADEPHAARPAAAWRRRSMIAAVLVAAVVVPLWLRAGLDGAAELRAAEEDAAAGQLDRRIEHLGRALRWRAPLWSHDEEALRRLWAIAEAEQVRGEAGRGRALAAYREVRRGLLATRAFGIPHRERWEEANARIAALMAEQEREMGLDTAAGGDPEAFHHALLRREPGPHPLRADLAALAFVAWLGSVAGFVLRGLDARGRLRRPAAARWGVAALVMLVAWAVLLATSHG